MKFRTLYTERVRVSHGPGDEPSMTKKADAAACDINNILRRYEKTGELPAMSGGEFLDCSGVEDYRHAMQTVLEAQSAFEDLGARVREHFRNDPAELIRAAFDPKRAKEFEDLGLTNPVDQVITPPGGVPSGDTGGKKSETTSETK